MKSAQDLPTKILAIHSFAVHGHASLKVMIRLLGGRVLPVPSLYLTGLTNIAGAQKMTVDFEKLLRGSLELARYREEKILVFVGYLGSADQADIILAALAEFQDIIVGLVVDPVAGDHGHSYVPASVIKVWPALLEQADWALPNFTEIQLILGKKADLQASVQQELAAFAERFPALQFLVSSVPARADQLSIWMRQGANWQGIYHPRRSQDFGGSGDVFASSFVNSHFFVGLSPFAALQLAARETLHRIDTTLGRGLKDIWLD